jgi:hypothetical protein
VCLKPSAVLVLGQLLEKLRVRIGESLEGHGPCISHRVVSRGATPKALPHCDWKRDHQKIRKFQS